MAPDEYPNNPRVGDAYDAVHAGDWPEIIRQLGERMGQLDDGSNRQGLAQRGLTKSILILSVAILQRAIDECPSDDDRAATLKLLAEAMRRMIYALPPCVR